MPSKNDLSGLLIIRLSDTDLQGQDVASQVKNKLGLVVESASTAQLLINMENVSFLGSAALGQLIMLKKKCDQKKIALALSNVSAKNLKVMKLVRFDELVNVFEDQYAAIESLSRTEVPEPQQPLTDAEYESLNARANEGEVDAVFELACRKSDGNGMQPNAVEAMHWFLNGAKQGHMESQHELATCYAFGLGVNQDYALAMPWYEKAANQGHVESQYMMGMSFQYALNDISDQAVARHWYEKAAAEGHEKAQLALSEMSR